MTKRIIVHLGMRKVSSTSIQQWLKENKLELLEQGVLYPKLYGREYNHNFLGKRIEKTPIEDFEDLVDEVLDSLSTQGRFDTLLLSYEGFFIDPTSSVFFNKLASKLNAYLEFVILIRNPADYINSWYSQRVSILRPMQSFEEQVYVDLNNLPEIKYNAAFKAFDKSCDKFTVIPMLPIENNFIEKVFSTLRLPIRKPIVSKKEFKNASLSPGIIEVYRKLALLLKEHGYKNANFNQHLNTIKVMIFEECDKAGLSGSSFYGVTPLLAEVIDTKLRESSEAFAQQSWNKSWSDVFPGSSQPSKQSNAVDINSSLVHVIDEVVETLWPKIIQEIGVI